MLPREEKIVIIDEAGFSQVCSSILEMEGFRAVTFGNVDPGISTERMHDAALVIASYPYGKAIVGRLRGLTRPVILLCDHMGRDIIDVLEGLSHSYCMVKPIDYARFTSLVRFLMNDKIYCTGGYRLV